MAWLLDTSVAILLRDGAGDIRERVEALDERPTLSVVTRVELEGGVYVNPAFAAQRRDLVDAMLEDLGVIDFDGAMAATYGRIVAVAGFSRRKIIDRMIAATAMVEGRTLITCNGDDFRDVPDLKVECWPNPLV